MPDFLSVTYGAGGHNRDTAHAVTIPFGARGTLPSPGAPHLRRGLPEETAQVIDEYLASGVRAFLALRGDPPREDAEPKEDELKSSIELISLLKARDQARCELSSANMLRAAIHPLIIGVATFPAGNPAAGTPTGGRASTDQAGRRGVLRDHPAFLRVEDLHPLRQRGSRGRSPYSHPGGDPASDQPSAPAPRRRTDGDRTRSLSAARPGGRGRRAAPELGISAGALLIEEVLAAGAPGSTSTPSTRRTRPSKSLPVRTSSVRAPPTSSPRAGATGNRMNN